MADNDNIGCPEEIAAQLMPDKSADTVYVCESCQHTETQPGDCPFCYWKLQAKRVAKRGKQCPWCLTKTLTSTSDNEMQCGTCGSAFLRTNPHG